MAPTPAPAAKGGKHSPFFWMSISMLTTLALGGSGFYLYHQNQQAAPKETTAKPAASAPQHDLKTELKPAPEAKNEPKPEVKEEPKPEPKPEVKEEPKTEPEPEVKEEPKPEPEPEVKEEPKPEPEPEVKEEPKPEPEVKEEPEPEPAIDPNAPLTVEGRTLTFSHAELKRFYMGFSAMDEAAKNHYADHTQWGWLEPRGEEKLEFNTISFEKGRWAGGNYSGTYMMEPVGKDTLFLTLHAYEDDIGHVFVINLRLDFNKNHNSGLAIWGGEESLYGNLSFTLKEGLRLPVPQGELMTENSPFTQLCRQVLEKDSPALWKQMQALAERGEEELTPLQSELFELAVFYTRPFRDAASRHYASRLRPLLAGIMAGQYVDSPAESGNTALHYAAAMGSRKLTAWLVLHGANINARNKDGQTPLDCLGVNKSGLDKWMESMGAVRSHELRSGDAVLMENGSTRYDDAPATAAEASTGIPPETAKLARELGMVNQVLQEYVTALSYGDMDTLLKCFDNRVDYFEEGIVDNDFIRRDNEAYFAKYPTRHFELVRILPQPVKGGYIVTAQAAASVTDSKFKSRFISMTYTIAVQIGLRGAYITRIRSRQQ